MPDESAYFDTAFLFRLYWDEAGAQEVRDFAARTRGLKCAIHGRAELIAAAHRKFREGAASLQELHTVLDQFESECDRGAIQWLALNKSVLGRVHAVYRSAPATTFLRAADALHLACAAESGCSEIYSNDRQLLAAADLFGLAGIDLIS